MALNDGLLPYINIPDLYSFAASNNANAQNESKSATESVTCQYGIPKGNRAIIAIGEVNGIIESQKDSDPFGSEAISGSKIKGRRSGTVTGITNCWVSVS